MNIIEQTEALKDLPDQRLMQEMQAPTGFAPQFLVLSELKRRKKMRDDYQRQQAADIKTVAEEAITAAGVPQGGITEISRAMNPNSSIAQNTGMDQAPQMQPTRMADGGVVKMQDGGISSQIASSLRNARPSERDQLRAQLISAVGLDAVREAESMMLPFDGGLGSVTQSRMQRQGIFANPTMSQQDAMANRQMIGGTLPVYRKGTGRATMVDGVFVELMPDGSVYNVRSGEPVTGDLAQKAISKLSPDLTEDTAAFTEFEGTPSIYRPEAGMPTQEDIDLKAASDARNSAFGIGESDVRPTLPSLGGEAPAAIGGINSFDVRGPAVPSLNAPEMSSPTEMMQFSQGMREVAADSQPDNPSIFDSIEGVVTGLTPSQKFQSESLNPVNIGSTELNQPAVRRALQGSNSAGLATGLMNAANTRLEEDAQREIVSQLMRENQAAYEEASKPFSLGDQMIAQGFTGGDIDPTRFPTAEERGIAQSIEAINNLGEYLANPKNREGYVSGMTIEEKIANPIEATRRLLGFDAIDTKPDTETETEAVVSNIPEGIGLNLPDTAAAERDTESTPTLSSTLSGLDDQSLSFGEMLGSSSDAKDTSTSPAGQKSSGGQKASATSSLGGIEGRIAQMLEEKEKNVQSDKWMALAQAGMALMASDAPTLGGAIGEAGLAGLGALKKGKAQYEKDVLDLLTLQQRIDAQKARMTSARKSDGLTASNMISLMDDLRNYKGDIQDRIDALNDPTNLMTEEEKAAQLQRLQAEMMRTDIELSTYRNALRGGGTTSTPIDVRGGSQTQSGVGYSLGTATQ